MSIKFGGLLPFFQSFILCFPNAGFVFETIERSVEAREKKTKLVVWEPLGIVHRLMCDEHNFWCA